MRFLRRDHRFFDADVGVVELHLALQPADFVLRTAHRLECLRQGRLESVALAGLDLGERHPLGVEPCACRRLGEVEWFERDVHDGSPVFSHWTALGATAAVSMDQ